MTSLQDQEIAMQLKKLNVLRGEIVRMARRGQLLEIKCEMPTCYCPKGRRHFQARSSPMKEWALNADHYPRLKTDGGKLTPGNIRLAHVRCNNTDFWWRERVRKMLDDGMSMSAIAEELNRQTGKKKTIKPPHGAGSWTPASVRKAYVS